MTSPFISQDVYLNNIGLDGIISSPGGSSVFPSGIVVHVTGTNYTYQTFNNGDTIRRSNGGVAMFDTLPEAKTNIYYPNGWVVWIENSDTVSLTITPVVSTINGLTSLVLSPEQTTRIISDGLNYYAFVTTSSSSIVTSIEGLTGAVLLSAGTGISIPAPSGQIITVNNTGVTGIEANTSGTLRTGTINFVNGTNTTVVDNGGGSFQINATPGAGGVSSFNTTTGSITLVSGTNTTVVANGGGSFQTNVSTGNSITTVSSALEVSSPVNLHVAASYTYLTTDRGKTINRSNSQAAMTDTLPQAGSTGFPAGWFTIIQNVDTTPTSGVGIYFTANLTLTPTTSTINGAQYVIIPIGQSARIVSDGTNYTCSVYTTYGNTANPIYNPNGVIIQPGGLTIVNQYPYGTGCTGCALNVIAQNQGANMGGVSPPDKCAVFASIYDQPNPPSFTTTLAASYTTTSVVLTSAVQTKYLNIGMAIFTSDSTYYEGIITTWGAGTTTTTVNVANWQQQSGFYMSSVTIVAIGSGYSINDVLTLQPGQKGSITKATVRVNTINGGGGILTYTLIQGGSYGGVPQTQPQTVTGGTGSGATFDFICVLNPGSTASGQVPSGGTVYFNPTTHIWSMNTITSYFGDGMTSAATGYECDVNNQTGIDDNIQSAIRGITCVNYGPNMISWGFTAIGLMYNGFVCGDTAAATGSNAGFLYQPSAGTAGAAFQSTQTVGYLVQSLSAAGSTSFAVTAATGQVDIGNFGKNGISSTPVLNFHSASQAVSGTYNTYDSQIQATGGTDGTVGLGTLTYTASTQLFTSPSTATGSYTFQPGGNNALVLSRVANAVNYIRINQSVTGTGTTITSAGSDTNVNLVLASQGTGNVVLAPNDSVNLTVTSTGQVTTVNNTLDNGSGNMTVAGVVNVGGAVGTGIQLSSGGITGANGANVVLQSGANGTSAFDVVIKTPSAVTSGAGTDVVRMLFNAGVAQGTAGIQVNETLYFTAAANGFGYAAGAAITADASNGNLILNANSATSKAVLLQGGGVTRMAVSVGVQVGASPTGGDEGVGTINTSAAYYVNGNTITDTAGHYVSNISTPGIAAGAGAGTGPTVSVVGTDNAGTISVTAGTTPSTSSTIVTITFTNTFGSSTPVTTLIPSNSNAFLLQTASTTFVTWTTNSTTLVLTSGSVALTNPLVYTWKYHVMH